MAIKRQTALRSNLSAVKIFKLTDKSALTRFEAWVGLVNNVNAAFTANNFVIAVALD